MIECTMKDTHKKSKCWFKKNVQPILTLIVLQFVRMFLQLHVNGPNCPEVLQQLLVWWVCVLKTSTDQNRKSTCPVPKVHQKRVGNLTFQLNSFLFSNFLFHLHFGLFTFLIMDGAHVNSSIEFTSVLWCAD